MADVQAQDPPSSPDFSSDLRNSNPIEAPQVQSPQIQSPIHPTVDDPQLKEQLSKVTLSDIGLEALLKRLKQSIASARDFAIFLHKRSSVEEEHSSGLKKLSRNIHESVRNPDHRHGTHSQAYDEFSKIQDRMAENGQQFALSLHQMSEDLQSLATNVERGRKHWKQVGTSAEKRVLDAENAMGKAKSKYDGLAEQYDRARTGDRQTGRFGLKGPRSAQQQEEDLHKKLQAADSDYASKVQAAQSQRQELISSLRPQAAKALQDLITECDSALTLQMQKFATFHEKLLLGNGLAITPLKSQNGVESHTRSLRDVISSINNEADFNQYVLGFSHRAAPRIGEIKYEQHPTLRTTKQTPTPVSTFGQRAPTQGEQPPFSPNNAQPQSSFQPPQTQGPPQIGQLSGITQSFQSLPTPGHPPAPQGQQQPNPYNTPPSQNRDPYSQPPPSLGYPPPQQHQQQQQPQPGPRLPPMSHEPFSMSGAVAPIAVRGPPQIPNGNQNHSRPSSSQNQNNSNLPPVNPVFGLSLEDLFRRDGSAVPMIVYQCLQAVDLFGLEVEGIYRTSGSNPHIMELKQMFDHDSSSVDFLDPSSFHHDISSVAGLLKLFFRSLPDPILTNQHYSEFISAAQIPDDILRRDSLHAIVNALPDPHYATLRVLTLHLNRVQEHSVVNRMTAQNLAIVWGPTMMGGADAQRDIRDAGWQSKVVETILVNTFQIFDDDE